MSYAFIVESGPRAGLRLPLKSHEPVVLGRGSGADVLLPQEDRNVSRRHARAEVKPDGVYLHDLAERKTTSVNGLTVRWARLSPGNVVRLGNTLLRLVYEGQSGHISVVGADDVSVYEVVDASQYHQGEMPPVSSRRPFMPRALLTQDPLPAAETRPLFDEAILCDNCGATGKPPESPDLWDAAWLCPACKNERWREEPGVPDKVGQFHVLRVLRRDSRGLLLEGTSTEHSVHAVIKMLPATEVSQQAIDRFIREQRIAAALRHPNIVRCYEVGDHLGHPFIVSEFISGGSALKIRGMERPVRDMLWLGADLFRALGYAHDLGIVHRDVSPATVLLTARAGASGARAKLADFGLAKSRMDLEIAASPQPDGVGHLPVTMSPEQLSDFINVAPSADVYSAAATLFFLLTGDTPLVLPCAYDQAPLFIRRGAIRSEARRSLGAIRPDVPAPVVALVDGLLTFNAGLRERMHAKEIAAALGELAERTSRSSSPRKSEFAGLPTPRDEKTTGGPVPDRFSMALLTLQHLANVLDQHAQAAAADVRAAADAGDPQRVERALARHHRLQQDVEAAAARWEELVSLP